MNHVNLPSNDNMSHETLPSIAEIRAATERLTHPEAANQVVRIRDFAVKSGPYVKLVEAKNIQYVREHSDVPVPKVHASFSETGTQSNFIIMEHIQGTPLDKLWPTLTDTEKQEVENQLKDIIRKLRSIQDPGYLGTPGRGPLNDGTLWDPAGEPEAHPFDDEDHFNRAIIRRLTSETNASYARFLGEAIAQTFQGYQTIFTHADFQMKNIMACRKGNEEFELTLIDWESAGWYPEYWEFSNAAVPARFRPEWLEVC